MLRYTDLPSSKKAFIFELDNVLYPEKDYLLQVYYLFANFLEYQEAYPPAADLTRFFKTAYEHHGAEHIFDRAREMFGIDERYRENFLRLHSKAQLPLKLLLFDSVLKLLQDIIVDRKQVFVLTNGDPEQQLNKIRQVEWNGLEKYLTVYFADEVEPKPHIGTLELILSKHQLMRRDLVVFGNSPTDEEFAIEGGVDYIQIKDIL